MIKRLSALLIGICFYWVAYAQVNTNLHIVARADNDLVVVLQKNGVDFRRFDDVWKAINAASPGSGLMVLADHYPDVRTNVDANMFAAAAKKNLRLYVEYPWMLPGMEVKKEGYLKIQEIGWAPEGRYHRVRGNGYILTGQYGAVLERTVVNSDAFGPDLPRLSILEMKDCHYVPVEAERPHLVLTRVEGYNTAVYGVTEEAHPLLFEHPNGTILVATTKLSQFVTGRYAPTDAWPHVIAMILKWVTGNDKIPLLRWTPTVRPMYSATEALPTNAQLNAIKRGADYYEKSNLYLHPGWPLLTASDPLEKDWPRGDGSYGIGECYISKRIFYTGNQPASLSARADCNLESAMGLACGSRLFNDNRYRDQAHKLNDFIAFNSLACKETRGDSTNPSYGLIGYYAFDHGAYWGDDNARALLSLMVSAGLMNEDRWDAVIVRGILANFRTSGIYGFRPLNISEKQLQEKGWEHFFNLDHIDYCPHMQAYIWATYLWLYDKTKFKPFLERAKTAIGMMMKADPNWRLEANRYEQERCRMLLPLAWLVRVENTKEHRAWLDKMAQYVISIQDQSGAIPQIPGKIVESNAGYGRGECAMAHKEGDPVTDALYSINFAFLGMHEAAAATGNKEYARSADKMADFFIRTQTQSQKHPELDGTWYRGFDFKKWDYWGSDGDIGWGVWSNEIGWTHSWITATLAVREMKTNFWDLTSRSKVASRFDYYRKMMLPDEVLKKEK